MVAKYVIEVLKTQETKYCSNIKEMEDVLESISYKGCMIYMNSFFSKFHLVDLYEDNTIIRNYGAMPKELEKILRIKNRFFKQAIVDYDKLVKDVFGEGVTM